MVLEKIGGVLRLTIPVETTVDPYKIFANFDIKEPCNFRKQIVLSKTIICFSAKCTANIFLSCVSLTVVIIYLKSKDNQKNKENKGKSRQHMPIWFLIQCR